MLRGVESLSMILMAWPVLLTTVYRHVPLPTTAVVTILTTISFFRQNLSLTRRTIRLFRFLGSFQKSYALYTAPTPTGGRGIDTWLDITCQSCLGIYGLLETITILDVAKVDNIVVWGAEQSRELNRQAQILWFIALYADILGSAWKLFSIFAHRPVPKDGKGFGTAESSGEKTEPAEEDEKKEAEAVVLTKDEELHKERIRLKGVVKKRKEERRAWMRSTAKKINTLGKKILINCLDSTLPAKSVGWIQVSDGVAGVIMLTTSVITGMDVWERMKGKE